MKLRTNNAMRNSLFTWITVVAVWLWLPYSIAKNTAETNTTKKPTLDQGTVQMLSNILESLDAFRNDRLKDLEKIRLAAPPTNGSTVSRSDTDVYKTPQNNSISEHIKALKEGIMGHNPVKKTFGYKVTVYTSPIGEDGKDGKPVLVTQYVGGDMAPDTPEAPDRRKGDIEDLQESANHPAKQLVHSSASAHLPVAVSLSDAGGGEGHEASSVDGATDHNRKTEHSASSEKGHQQGHSLHSKVAKGHDHERHSNKHDEHHKETEKESHRHDTQAHDKGGATQQGIRERTEIEYYEREHFLDTEYDKAKKGHDKTSGLKEHESHNDHDSYEDKKLHAKENSDHHKTHTGGSVATGSDTETAAIIDDHVRSPHYSPPYGVHYKKQPHVAHDGHHLKEDSHALKEDAESSRLHHSEESKGHREHNSERNLHKEENDKGYLDKDKGRRKEGYRERGYKITAEREYFLNDAHHDKGSSTHTSGSKLKDQEGTAHGSKEGERDRGFTKEEKIEEAHDAAYDAKNRHYYDGEQHKEDFSSGKSSSSSSGQKTQKEELVPLAPPAVNYVDAQPHPLPIFPLPIAYSPSNDGAKAVVAYPPDSLSPGKKIANDYQPPITNSRQARNGRPSVSDLRKQEPIGGYDDDYDRPEKNGYVGHASYKKRNPSPLIASIRDSVRKDVHAKPPSYSKSESTSSEENSVRFPAEENEKHKFSEERDSEEESEEVVFPQDDKQYKGDNRDRGNEDGYHLTPKPPTLIDLRKEHRHTAEKDRSYPEVPNQTRYHQNDNLHHKQYPQLQNTRDAQRYYEQIQPDVREVQHPDKLLRTVDLNAYSNIQSGKVPTNGHLSHDVLRYSQPQINQPYADVQRRNRNNNQVLYPDIQSFYNLGNQGPFGQRQLRVEKQPQNSLNVQQDHHTSRINQLLQTTQQQPVGRINQLIHNTQQQNPRPLTSVEQLPRAMSPLEQLQQLQARVTAQQQNNQRGLTLTQQHQNTQRGVTPLEQLQQQTKPPFSPVVLLSRGPPSQTQNHAVDVWYTRQQS